MSGGFDALRTSRPRSRARGCAKCGEETAASVQLIARERAEHGKAGPGLSISSKMVSLCERCTVEVYTAVEAVLLAAVGETR